MSNIKPWYNPGVRVSLDGKAPEKYLFSPLQLHRREHLRVVVVLYKTEASGVKERERPGACVNGSPTVTFRLPISTNSPPLQPLTSLLHTLFHPFFRPLLFSMGDWSLHADPLSTLSLPLSLPFSLFIHTQYSVHRALRAQSSLFFCFRSSPSPFAGSESPAFCPFSLIVLTVLLFKPICQWLCLNSFSNSIYSSINYSELQ